ncbi:MAG: hypothetical protein LBQ75_07835 [Zoogloeaceae bacterium]|nr:hypothetical protein [Zoogloeaceae bacterium]
MEVDAYDFRNDKRIVHIEKRRDGQVQKNLYGELYPNSRVIIPKPTSEWHKELLDHPTARYHLIRVGSSYPGEPISLKVYKLEEQIVDSQTGEILGRELVFRRRLPAAEGSGFFMNNTCSFPTPTQEELREKRLVPQTPLRRAVFKPINVEPTKEH